MRLRYLALFVGIVAAAPHVFAQDITTHHVSGQIYMLEGRGGNIGVSAGEDGLLIIDTQYANMAGPIRDALAELSTKPIHFIVNTHYHADHTGGNEPLGQNAPIVAHQNVRARLVNGKDLTSQTVRNGLPQVMFDDDMTLHYNAEPIQVIHFANGHTDGDCIILFTESNVAHLGDHFFNGAFPFIDLAGGGDVQGYIDNVGKMIEMLPDDVMIIPGHGPLATKQDLRQFHTVLKNTTDLIRQGIETGRNEDALQQQGLPEEYAPYGQGFVSTRRWISIVYNSFTR